MYAGDPLNVLLRPLSFSILPVMVEIAVTVYLVHSEISDGHK